MLPKNHLHCDSGGLKIRYCMGGGGEAGNWDQTKLQNSRRLFNNINKRIKLKVNQVQSQHRVNALGKR